MAVATPNVNGGYQYSFVDTLHERYICKVCQLPSRDPYLSECCGNLFCKCCLSDVKTVTAITNTCPVCRDEEFKTFRNKAIDREIKDLHIYCTNKEKGCKWQSKLSDVNEHLGNSVGCRFEEVNCSNECEEKMERRFLTSHVETECPRRKVNCQYCHDTGEHQFIEGQHKEECPKLPLPCPNKCEVGSVPREDMEAHRKECPLKMIRCGYHSVGCEVRMARKDQERHETENMKEHLAMTKCELTRTKVTLTNTDNKLANSHNELSDTRSQLANALQRICTLEVLLYLATNKTVAMPSSTAIVLESSLKWCDKLVTMVMMSRSRHQECPVTFKMLEFNKHKVDNTIWNSVSFYTHNKGYKMCVKVYAAGMGDGENTHLSVFLVLMKGPNDDELEWPMKVKFEMKLLNQISNSEHYTMSVTYDEKTASDSGDRVTEGDKGSGWGHSKFICNEDLQKAIPTCQYLKDDCVFFEVAKL